MPLPLALTMGEPAGIGGEISLLAWKRRGPESLAPFFVIDDSNRLAALARALKLDVPIKTIANPGEASACFASSLPVLHRPLPVKVAPGKPDAKAGRAVISSIEEAVRFAQSGEAGGIVTNPIHKKALYDVGFKFPGDTEFLAELAGGIPVGMLLVCEHLRTLPVSIHIALKQAIETLSVEAIVGCGRILEKSLRQDFGIAKPRIAVAGLNPHAGESGAMGREDIEIVAPAIEILRTDGISVKGPMPPDTMFHAHARATYDAALCMYHDQALIPIKALDFDGGVNVTIGLPFVRTSPDHGTAFDIAGSGKAKPDSLIAALKVAGEMARHRSA